MSSFDYICPECRVAVDDSHCACPPLTVEPRPPQLPQSTAQSSDEDSFVFWLAVAAAAFVVLALLFGN